MIEDPVLRQRLSFSRTNDSDGEEVLHVEIWLDPGGGVTPHIHPAMEERFEVLEGNPSFLSGRAWSTAAPGETVLVPAGARHAYRNRSGQTAHMVCHAKPPSTLGLTGLTVNAMALIAPGAFLWLTFFIQ